MDHAKFYNEKDPELRYLFNIISNDEPVIKKSGLIDTIKEFDLPIDFEEFFQPVGKKEDITFHDFCSLFKSKNLQNEMFLRTFASSFHNLNNTLTDSNPDLFPIHVKRK